MKRKHTAVRILASVGAGLLFLVGVITIVYQSQHSIGERFMLSGAWVVAWFIVSTGMLSAFSGVGITSTPIQRKPAMYIFAVAVVLVVVGAIIDAG